MKVGNLIQGKSSGRFSQAAGWFGLIVKEESWAYRIHWLIIPGGVSFVGQWLHRDIIRNYFHILESPTDREAFSAPRKHQKAPPK
jgi:hypothetical protein